MKETPPTAGAAQGSFDREPERAARTALPVRDIGHALQVAGGSRALADKLFAQLCRELPGQLALMQRHAAAGDRDELWRITHQLHGSTAVCGAPALNQAAELLEHAIKNGDDETCAWRLKQLAGEVNRLLQETPE